jgi:uncharacterized protein (TIGR03083 family)
MESTARTWIAALRGSQQRLAALVGSLIPEQLHAPSYDAGRTIAQVLAHIGAQAEVAQQSLAAALSDRKPFGPDGFSAIQAVWSARDPGQQAVECLVSDREHVRRLEQVTDEQLAGMRVKILGTEYDAIGMIWLRLGEHALHSWDIAVSLDPAAVVAPQSVGLLVDWVPQVAACGGKPPGVPYRAGISTTDPEREFLLEVAADTISMSTVRGGAGGEGIPALRMPAEALLRLVYGRLDPGHTPPVQVLSGRVELDLLRQTFPGV